MKNLFKALADFQQEVPIIHKGTSGYGYLKNICNNCIYPKNYIPL